MTIRIVDVDPHGGVAMALLREAATEVRPLYSSAIVPSSAPSNPPLGPRDAYVAVLADDEPIACGSLRELDVSTAEIRRIYVRPTERRHGVGRALLSNLLLKAERLRYGTVRVETGNKQLGAIALYEGLGFVRIAPFGPYVSDPTSVCFERGLRA